MSMQIIIQSLEYYLVSLTEDSVTSYLASLLSFQDHKCQTFLLKKYIILFVIQTFHPFNLNF